MDVGLAIDLEGTSINFEIIGRWRCNRWDGNTFQPIKGWVKSRESMRRTAGYTLLGLWHKTMARVKSWPIAVTCQLLLSCRDAAVIEGVQTKQTTWRTRLAFFMVSS